MQRYIKILDFKPVEIKKCEFSNSRIHDKLQGYWFVKKTSNLSGSILAYLKTDCRWVEKTAEMSDFYNTLTTKNLHYQNSRSPQKPFQFASIHLVICGRSPCNLRQITLSSASNHMLAAIVSHAFKPSLTAIQTTNDALGDKTSHSDRQTGPSEMAFPFRRTSKNSDRNL